MSLHITLMLIAGTALLAAILGSALGWWIIAPHTTGRSQMLIRFGMALAAVSCISSVLSSLALGATWRDRVHWELAADAGFAVLAIGLLVGAIERERLRRTAGNQRHKQHAHSQGDD